MIHKLSLLILLYLTENRDCIKTVNSCKCDLDNGTYIDISALANSDGSPRFKDVSDNAGQALYSYNPCTGFTEGTCQNVAVCQKKGTTYTSLGDQQLAQCHIDQNGALILFSTDSDRLNNTLTYVPVTTAVYLVCDSSKEGELQVPGEVYPGSFLIFLIGRHSCLMTTDDTNSNSGFSTGTYISIGFGGVLVLYLISGMLYKGIIKSSTGKDLIPNVNTWSSLAILIKDGISFVVCWPRRKGYSRSL